jgi:hypothetical protein
MDKQTRQKVLGQWGVREESLRERATGRALQAELDGSVAEGRPLQLRRRHFRPSVDSYVASLGGLLPYMLRLLEIERLTNEHAAALELGWRELAAECEGDALAFEQRWRAETGRHDFEDVNRLIETHNRWYPVEARLPMDVRRRDYVLVGGQPYTRRRLDAGWVLERFPPDLELAAAQLA